MALELGLKVDVEALPGEVVTALTAGEVDLASPATTVVLLQANAVVGVTGIFDEAGNMTSMGIQCALCHSTVDDSFAPGIGKRRDGWANRDLNVGAIISAAPDLSTFTTLLKVDEATVKAVLAGWGPGKFDAELILDGKGINPDTGDSGATLIPAAFGLSGVNLHTYTGWGSVTYWNAFVANLDARPGHVLRSQAERRAALSDCRGKRLRQRAQRKRPHHTEARGAAFLSARDRGSQAAHGQLRRGGRRARR
jgi:hypothetical protein